MMQERIVMKTTLTALCWGVICLSIIFSSGCATTGQTKTAPRIIGEGVKKTGLIIYDVGAVTINTTWGIASFGYGFEEGNTLLPLYEPSTDKFIAHKF
jgi:hypothetical protein